MLKKSTINDLKHFRVILNIVIFLKVLTKYSKKTYIGYKRAMTLY